MWYAWVVVYLPYTYQCGMHGLSEANLQRSTQAESVSRIKNMIKSFKNSSPQNVL